MYSCTPLSLPEAILCNTCTEGRGVVTIITYLDFRYKAFGIRNRNLSFDIEMTF